MWVYADYSAQGRFRDMGLVDWDRLPHEGYWFFKSLWNPEPMVYICGHWSWPESVGQQRTITIFTNCPENELFLNGDSLGTKPPDAGGWPQLPYPPVQWTLPYEPGELKAVGYGEGMSVEDVRISEESPAAVRLKPEGRTLQSDGQDCLFITAEVLDSKGNRCYRCFADIELEVEGAGYLAGGFQREVRGGLVRFAVRSDGSAGPVVVRAFLEGIKAADLNVKAVEPVSGSGPFGIGLPVSD